MKMAGKNLTKISQSSLSMYLAYAVQKGCVFLLAAVIARRIGPAGLGLYCLALVLLDLGLRLAVFGTDILVVRDLSSAQPDVRRLLGNSLSFRIIAGVLVSPLLVLAASLLSESPDLPLMVAIMGAGMVAQGAGELFLSVAQGRERVDLSALALSVTGAAGLGLALAALAAGLGLIGVAAAYSLRGAIGLLLGMGICSRLGERIRGRFETAFIRRMLVRSAPIGLDRFLTVLYLGSGMAVLQYFRGAADVGYFAGAMKLFEAGGAFGMLTMTAAFPTIARLHATMKEELRATARKFIRLFCWLGIPISVAVALNAGRILVLLFGPEFINAGSALGILMLAVPLSLNSGLVERLAYAANDQKRVLLIRALGSATNLILIFSLINRLDYVAPALAILGAEAVMFLLYLYRSGTYVPGLNFLRSAFTRQREP